MPNWSKKYSMILYTGCVMVPLVLSFIVLIYIMMIVATSCCFNTLSIFSISLQTFKSSLNHIFQWCETLEPYKEKQGKQRDWQ